MHRFIPPATLLAAGLVLAACDEGSTPPPETRPKTSRTPPSAVATPTPVPTPSFVPAPVPTPFVVQVGAGFNEQIANVNNTLIAQSGVRWVRAYVNLARNYWVFGPATTNVPPRYPIIGFNTNNLIQDASDVSSDADVLAIAALDQLINTKTVAPAGQPMKVILSLKHDFSYPYPAGTTNFPFNQFPDLSTPDGATAVGHMVSAIFNILTTNDRGAGVDIVVTGNEPMFEIQPNSNPITASNYAKYLNHLVGQLAALRASNNWPYQIYVGALNSPLAPPPAANLIAPAILGVASTNTNVAGIDLHEHVASPSEVTADINYVKSQMTNRTTPWNIISTEFSIIRCLETNMTTPMVGTGGNLAQYINATISNAAAGTPVTPAAFLATFQQQPWYPANWFNQMMSAFQSERVYAVTYGFDEPPRYPWTNNYVRTNVNNIQPWVLLPVYNATLFGRVTNGPGAGVPVTNPLSAPGFQAAIQNMQ